MNKHYGSIVGDFRDKESAVKAARDYNAKHGPRYVARVTGQRDGRWRVMAYPA